MVEESISSYLDSRPESKEPVDALTPEDIAWVDSCLINETPDISDGNWNNMKSALLEILDLYPESFASSAVLSDNAPGGTKDDIDMLPSNNEKESIFPWGDDDDPMSEPGIASEDPRDHDDIDTSLSLSFSKNPFLPTYKEDVGGKENTQTGSSQDLSEIGYEFPVNDIFRVWDLNLPPVEDELLEQLNKALSENSFKSLPSMWDNRSVLKDFKEESLDDLINSISDLSLEQNN
ncbi:uncharacterized protein LOC111007546 [Momordica charantia]|uniref:Uncharacterized protein LOC111007546 n=1 Tax=Momordica charantia TaxID=3673 RepID=A0A6J1C3A0_MOMCH|nr:uncharacterized protein LOC111007546 [Momordica charantia]